MYQYSLLRQDMNLLIRFLPGAASDAFHDVSAFFSAVNYLPACVPRIRLAPIPIMASNEGDDLVLQIPHRAEATARSRRAGRSRKPNLNLPEPQGVLRNMGQRPDDKCRDTYAHVRYALCHPVSGAHRDVCGPRVWTDVLSSTDSRTSPPSYGLRALRYHSIMSYIVG